MFETMHAANGAGLAAPQIGVDLQLVIFGFEQQRALSGCAAGARDGADQSAHHAARRGRGGGLGRLPVGAWNARRRAALVAHPLRGFDQHGAPIEREADGFHARVVQHECDHLIGTLYPMRIRDFSRFGFTSVLFPELDPGERRLRLGGSCKGRYRRPERSACRVPQPLNAGGDPTRDACSRCPFRTRGSDVAEAAQRQHHDDVIRSAPGILPSPWAIACIAWLWALGAAAQPVDVDPPGRVARVGEVYGQAWVYSPDTGEWIDAHRNQPMTGGDRVATDRGGRVVLEIGSTTLRIDSGTSSRSSGSTMRRSASGCTAAR